MHGTHRRQNPATDIERDLAADDCANAFRCLQRSRQLLTADQREDLLFRIGLQTEDKRVREQAIALYEGSIDHPEDSEYCLERLAALHLAAGNKAASFVAYCRLLALENTDGKTRWYARYALADAIMELGHPQPALDMILPALRVLTHEDPNTAPVLALMGKIHLGLGSPETGCRWYEKAMSLDRNETSWPKELALMLEKAGAWKLALKYWNWLLAIEPMKMSETVCDSCRPLHKVQHFMKDVSLAKAHKRICEEKEKSSGH